MSDAVLVKRPLEPVLRAAPPLAWGVEVSLGEVKVAKVAVEVLTVSPAFGFEVLGGCEKELAEESLKWTSVYERELPRGEPPRGAGGLVVPRGEPPRGAGGLVVSRWR